MTHSKIENIISNFQSIDIIHEFDCFIDQKTPKPTMELIKLISNIVFHFNNKVLFTLSLSFLLPKK